MNYYDVQVETELGEIAILQVAANSTEEAELTAINMVELGEVETCGRTAIDSFVCWDSNDISESCNLYLHKILDTAILKG